MVTQKEVTRDIAEKEAYGITRKSTEFVREHLKDVGSVVQIECLLAGNTHAEYGKEQWVAFVDERGNRIVVSGFSWGYIGEGPYGLQKMAQELGFNLDIDTVTHFEQSEYWTMCRERKELTEDLARYIIGLQDFAELEVGLEKDDIEIRHRLELEFPDLRWEREQADFNNWLWSVRTEQETDVVKARALMGHDIPFEEIYHADTNPEADNSTYDLYRKHTEVAGDIFQEVKENAKARLIKLDAEGDIDLKKEWRGKI